MNKSSEIGELVTALASAQKQYKQLYKSAINPYFKSGYATLADQWESVRDALSDNGLAFIQTTECRDGQIVLISILGHKSGQWLSGEYIINPVKNDPQSFGSAISYARRYTMAAMLGLAAEDDDGNEASKKQEDKENFNRWLESIEKANTIEELIEFWRENSKSISMHPAKDAIIKAKEDKKLELTKNES